jgi:hypothetical protein
LETREEACAYRVDESSVPRSGSGLGLNRKHAPWAVKLSAIERKVPPLGLKPSVGMTIIRE